MGTSREGPPGASGSIVGTVCPGCEGDIKFGQLVAGNPPQHLACWDGWKNYQEKNDPEDQRETSTNAIR